MKTSGGTRVCNTNQDMVLTACACLQRASTATAANTPKTMRAMSPAQRNIKRQDQNNNSLLFCCVQLYQDPRHRQGASAGNKTRPAYGRALMSTSSCVPLNNQPM